MIVVCNTSPIINLAAVGQLNLLHQLYGQIVIPAAVYQEIVGTVSDDLPGALEVRTLDWIESRAVTEQTLVAALALELDEGEAEAVALASELNADLIYVNQGLKANK